MNFRWHKYKISLFVILFLPLLLLSEINVTATTDNVPKKTYIPLNANFSNFFGFQSLVQNTPKKKHVEGELIVKYKKDKNISLMKIKDGKDVESKVAELKQDSTVEYAEPNYIREAMSIPNDTRFSEQWYLKNTGQTVNGVSGTNDADIDVPEAWDIFAGSNQVIVAVIDTGTAYNHPDLINNMWNGVNCVDYNGAPLGNCIHGYDFVFNDKDPYSATQDYHGTHVAGIIGATSNNGTGISGTNPGVQIMDLRAGYNGSFSDSSIVNAINFAIHNGAKIINLSAGGYSYSVSLYNAILAFRNEVGGIFIAAAGNDGYNNDINPMYPASYNLDNIISVASTDQNDNKSSFSNYGATSVDIGAPGSNILSTYSISSTSENVFTENFGSAVVPGVPAGWTKSGTAGTALYLGNKFGIGDTVNYPYNTNADYSLYSPIINLSNASIADLSFIAICDTEPTQWYDYMTLELSNNSGSTYPEGIRFDETQLLIYGGVSSGDFVIHNFSNVDIPSSYFTSGFKMRLHWRTDSTDSDHYGCYVSDIKVDQNRFDPTTYNFLYGTSMATPVVAGVASLVWGYNPNLTYSEVKNIILNSGDSKASLTGKTVSGKRVNANNALLLARNNLINPSMWFLSGAGNWSVNNAIYSVSGDFNGDGFDEIASMYDYGSNDMGINVFSASGSTFTWTQWYRSGKNMWGVAYTKYLTAGDYNNDGKDEITAMYDYGNNNMGLNVFSASGSTFTWNRWYLSGPNNWGVPYTKFVTSGDYNEDGKSEIAAMYDYGSNNMGLNVFSASGSTFTWNQWYLSGKGNWGVPYTKFVTSGDFNDDGKDEITTMYDYGSNNMGLNVFSADPITPDKFIWNQWYLSGAGNWGVLYTKYVTAGDYNDDGKDEITAMYDYGTNNMGLNVFSADPIIPNKFIWNQWYRSGPNNWGVPYTKFVTSGDFNNDGFDEVATMYDYGSNNMGIHVFTPY